MQQSENQPDVLWAKQLLKGAVKYRSDSQMKCVSGTIRIDKVLLNLKKVYMLEGTASDRNKLLKSVMT